MKRLSVIAVLALIGKPAFAAPPAPAPVYSWTGFYVGGNVGYGWGDAGTNIAGSASTIALPTIGGGFPGNNVAFADSGTERLKGVIGGGQFGYNLQFSRRWLLGFEADIQGSGERGSNAFADSFSATVCNSGVFPPVLPVSTLARSMPQRRRLMTPRSAGLGRFAGVLGF